MVALKAMTLWAAHQHFEEKTKGSIEVGKLADFAVLSDNPLTIDRMKIADIKVVETIKKGRSIYRSDPARVTDDSPQCIESPQCYQRFVAFRSHGPMTDLFGVPPHGTDRRTPPKYHPGHRA